MAESPLEPRRQSRSKPLSDEEIRAALPDVPPIVSPKRLAAVLDRSVKTMYEWIAQGRLDGAFRKRGKHILIWRDRALKLIFNGPEWETNEPD